jgi:hypothetical protein
LPQCSVFNGIKSKCSSAPCVNNILQLWNRYAILSDVLLDTVNNQESHETFIRTIQVLEPGSAHRSHKFKAVLDAGCLAGDLITLEVIAALGCMDKVQPCDEVLGICLHGDVLKSTGTIDLQWEGTGLYKLFKSRFHVVESRPLAWQIIVGAETCALHSLLTVGAFGGSKHQVFQKKGKSKPYMHNPPSSS